jgi:hypothetical protein
LSINPSPLSLCYPPTHRRKPLRQMQAMPRRRLGLNNHKPPTL